MQGLIVRLITSIVAALLAASGYADEPSNRIERAAKKAGHGADQGAHRAQASTERTVDRAGKWADRTGKRAGKVADRAVRKTETWIQKKTD